MKRIFIEILILVFLVCLVVYYPPLRTLFDDVIYDLMKPVRVARLVALPPDLVLRMPVEGVRVSSVVDTWGGSRSGGRSHEGQDIFARRGTPVYSATEGVVLRKGQNALGGNIIFVLGAGGRRYYYAHLDSHAPFLDVGQEISTTTLLGFVGNTGNASGTPPHLHFGMYGEGQALNPLPLLEDR